MKNKLFILILGLLLISSVSAVCTVSFEKESYFPSETITAAMVCDTNQEKSQAYTLNWTYANGTQLELDTGITPAIVSEYFYETYVIDSDWPEGVFINATLQGTNLEGTDSANVSGASANTLVIVDSIFGGGFIGKESSIKATVVDENGKKVSGGNCKLSLWSNDETQMLHSDESKIYDSEIKFNWVLRSAQVAEGTQYAYKIKCFCGSDGGENECIDEDGSAIEDSIGSIKASLLTKTWIASNTVTNKDSYVGREELFICANLTNIERTDRIPVEIYHQLRCSQGLDLDSDTDRALVLSDNLKPDERGISTNTTQMQCKRFVIPEPPFLQGNINTCYASTSVWVLNENIHFDEFKVKIIGLNLLLTTDLAPQSEQTEYGPVNKTDYQGNSECLSLKKRDGWIIDFHKIRTPYTQQ